MTDTTTRIRSTINGSRLREPGPDDAFVLAGGLAGPGAIPVDAVIELVIDAWMENALATNYSQLTLIKYCHDARQFAAFCLAHGAGLLADVDRDLCAKFVHSEPVGGRHLPALADGLPAYGTQVGRKTTLRNVFTSCFRLGLTDTNPGREVPTLGRSTRLFRPLTDDEVERCKVAAMQRTRDARLPALLAVALGGATLAEAPFVEVGDVAVADRLLYLPGMGRRTMPRWVPLDDWQMGVIAHRIDRLETKHRDDPDWRQRPLVYNGQPYADHQMKVAQVITGNMRRILDVAGLPKDQGYAARCVLQYAAQKVYRETGSVDAVAVRCGLKSLESAAKLIDCDWRARWELHPTTDVVLVRRQDRELAALNEADEDGC